MSNLPFDLTKLDHDKVRKLQRKTALKWSIAPAVLILLLALWFMLPMPLTYIGIKNYEAGQYDKARWWVTAPTWTSPEPFVAQFNAGTIDVKRGEYKAAEKHLTVALALAPLEKRCMVARNLVISFASHVKSLGKDTAEAKIPASKARNVIRANQECFKGIASSGGGSGSSSAQEQSPTDTQEQELQQKELKGQERKEQFAQDEEYDAANPRIKPW